MGLHSAEAARHVGHWVGDRLNTRPGLVRRSMRSVDSKAENNPQGFLKGKIRSLDALFDDKSSLLVRDVHALFEAELLHGVVNKEGRKWSRNTHAENNTGQVHTQLSRVEDKGEKVKGAVLRQSTVQEEPNVTQTLTYIGRDMVLGKSYEPAEHGLIGGAIV